MNKNKSISSFFVSLVTAFSMNSSAVTVDAGDYTRLPDGTNLAVLYLQHTSGSDLYVNGDKASSNADLDANVGIFRTVHFMDIGDFTVAHQFLLPFGEVKTGGDLDALESANGIGDLIVNPTIHLMQDPERKKALAFTPWLYIPTGDYDREKDINALGENRWKLALQLGYITPISEKWTFDILGDVMFFGENDDFTTAGLSLKQDPLYEIQTHLRYNVAPGTHLAGTLSHSWGGETEIAGVKQNNEQERTKALFTLGHFISPTWQILASYGQDISVEEGVSEDHRFNIRLLKVF